MGTVSEDILSELLSGITFDDASLASVINGALLHLDAVALPEIAEDSAAPENPYTTRTTVPPYEVTEQKPLLSSIYDTTKCEELLQQIDASSLPEDEKSFLRAAAYRHVVFNFREVANYYVHSESEMQKHCEASALVIVDLGAAITSGWVSMSETLDEIFTRDSEANREQN
jgi:hypothetical protein